MQQEFAISIKYKYIIPILKNNGKAFTNEGPPVGPPGSNILDDEELLWLEDSQWDESRILSAQNRLQQQGLTELIKEKK